MALWDHGLSLELTDYSSMSQRIYSKKTVVLSLLKIKLKCLGNVKKVKIHSDNLLVLFSMFFVKHYGVLLHIFFQYSQVLYIYCWSYFILSFDDKFSVLKKLEQNFKKEFLVLESL